MVHYRCAGDEIDGDFLEVDTSESGFVTIAMEMPGSDRCPLVTTIARDAVAALVGQLQSWLARTEARP